MLGGGVSSSQRKSFHWPTTTFVMYEKQRQSQFKSSRRVSSLEENRIQPKHRHHHHKHISKSTTHLSTMAPRSRSSSHIAPVDPQKTRNHKQHHSHYLKVPDTEAHFPNRQRLRSSSAPTEIEAISAEQSHSKNDKQTQERSDEDDQKTKHSKKISLSRLPNFFFTKCFVHVHKNHP